MVSPPQELIEACLALASGQLEPADWLAWWDGHEDEVEKSVPRGWFLRLKPRGREGVSINGVLLDSQRGACQLLDQLAIPYEHSSRYEIATKQEMAAFHQSTKRPKSPDDTARVNKLAERFGKLGVADPDAWARSEVEEDIPQLATLVFLRELWKLMVPVGEIRALSGFDRSCGDALQRLKKQGAELADVLLVVRAAQADIVRQIAYLLDQVGDREPGCQDVRWRLYELNDDDQPARPMDSLHESVDTEVDSPLQVWSLTKPQRLDQPR